MKTISTFFLITFVTSAILSNTVFPWASVSGGTHKFINETAYNLLLVNDPAFNKESFPLLTEIIKRVGYGNDDQDRVTGPDSAKASYFTEHYYNPITKDGDGPTSVYEQYRILNNQKIKDKDSFESAKAAAWSAHYIADMTVPYHVIGTTDAKIRNIYKDYENNDRPIILPEEITGSVSDLRGNIEAPRDYRELIKKYFAANDNDEYTQFFDPWYWNSPGWGFSSHLGWEGISVTSANPPQTLQYDSLWKNPKETSFSSPWLINEEVVTNYVKEIAKKTRREIPTRISSPNSGRDEAIIAVSTLWRASISALTPTLEIYPVDGTNNNIEFYVIGYLENRSKETAKNVELRLLTEGASIIEGSIDIIRLEDIPAGLESDGNLVWKITVNNLVEAKLKLETVGLYEKTPDLQYNLYTYDFKSASDSVIAAASFKFNYEVLFKSGEDEDIQITNLGNGTPMALTPNGDLFSISGTIENQTVNVNVKLSADGGKISKVEILNESFDDSDYIKLSAKAKVVLENLPIKYSYHLGGGIYIYAFWAKPYEIEQYTTYSDYSGWGKYSDVDEDGNQIWKDYTMETKRTLWGTSIIYLEFMNKTQAEIQAIISSGKLTQEKYNKNLAHWQKTVNSSLGN